MKSWKLIVATVVVLFIVRAAFVLKNKLDRVDDERRQFAKDLNYEFTSVVDSITMRDNAKVGIGTVYCTISSGSLDPFREDRMRRQLRFNESLWFNATKQRGKLVVTVPFAGECVAGDSVMVSSVGDAITVRRKLELVTIFKLSDALEGRPSF